MSVQTKKVELHNSAPKPRTLTPEQMKNVRSNMIEILRAAGLNRSEYSLDELISVLYSPKVFKQSTIASNHARRSANKRESE